jgi:sterol desaturase/sphingolipid hydroxylase (fatty acid hydroxylase superfamily)
MDWLLAIGGFWLTTLKWVVGLGLAFGILTRLMPCNPGMYWWRNRRALATDILYWFVVPLFVRLGELVLLRAAVMLLWSPGKPQLLPVGQLPLWQQCLAILLLQDFLLYWGHRVFHTRWAWPMHAVHHSPEDLDWTSAARFHPLNSVITFGLVDVIAIVLGFAPEAWGILIPLNQIYSSMVHANLNWTFGPLRYIFASPVFHRWHHTTQAEGLDKNFAPTFPFLDVLFGSFYMPPGRLPERFGTGDPAFPEGFWGQLVHPFRGAASQPEPSGTVGTPALKRAWLGPTAVLLVLVGALGVELLGPAMYSTAPPIAPGDQAAGEWNPVPVQPGPDEADQPALARGHEGAVLSVAISARGECVASAGEDGTVRIWDGPSGQERLTLTGHTRPVRGVAISADGSWVVSAGYDQTVRVWDARTGQPRRLLRGHTGGILAVAMSADGQRLVSGGADFTARVWDAAAGRAEFVFNGPPAAVLGVAVSADGQRVVASRGRVVMVYDAAAGRECTLSGHSDLVYGVAISPDGRCIVSGSCDGTVKLWDAATGRERLTLTGHAGPVYGVGISGDGCRIVSGGADRTVRVWDVVTGREQHTHSGHTEAVTSVALSATGRRVVSGGRDGTVQVWDAPGPSPGGAVTPGAAR